MKRFLAQHKILQAVLCVLFFIAGMALIILGQKEIGLYGIAKMLLGLAMLLALLGYFNSFYNK